MKLDQNALNDIGAIINQSRRPLIIPHRTPDGDTLGAALGLYQVLKNLGKAPEVICFDKPADIFEFLPNINRVKVGSPQLDYDAYFIPDAGATHLTGFHETHPQLFDKSLNVINIDHHPSNNYYGKANLVVTSAASATAIVTEMLEALSIPIDRNTATCLLTGIYTDTGSFQHANTSAETLRIAARLLARGADLRHISKSIFNTTKISTMHLWGRVLKSIYQTPEKVTMAVVTEQDFKDCGAVYDELNGAVDYVNSVPGSKYSVILTERAGKVKGSLRTLKDEVDVAQIAANYGGGGHTKAAGFTVTGKLEKEIKWKVVE
ncbi:hypothetical protein COY07_02950 [Candidatus Peregrinibacteria bacterium CG_4_10_14_0_2_um_filter_43_11]|nr:MAG: hypothetical protein COY07_02950 [Candidatus Peregrinibacteria bacterium CG_4_10_14_0_2_um_filter_43_11]